MQTKAHAHSDPHLVGRDLFNPTHHPEAFVAIDQGEIVGRALRRMHNSRSVNGPDPCADPPFQPVAAREWTQHPGKAAPRKPSRVQVPGGEDDTSNLPDEDKEDEISKKRKKRGEDISDAADDDQSTSDDGENEEDDQEIDEKKKTIALAIANAGRKARGEPLLTTLDY